MSPLNIISNFAMISKNYLIVGGLGFIGANLANRIFELQPESTITVVDSISDGSDFTRLSYELRKCVNFHFIVGDLSNEPLVKKVIEEYKIDTVILSAILTENNADTWQPVRILRNNLTAVTHFLEVLRKHEHLNKLVYISSEEVYGLALPKVETTTPHPISSEGASQASAEQMLNAYAVSYRIPFVIVRLSGIVYGCSMNRSNPFVGLLEGNSIGEARTGKHYGMLHIRDACDGIVECIINGKVGETYNIGGKYELTKREILDCITKIRNGESISVSEFTSASMNCKKALENLNFKPAVPFEKGLTEVVTSYVCSPSEMISPTRTPFRFLMYGDNEWLEEQIIQQIKRQGYECFISRCHPGEDSDEAVCGEINSIAPSHIIASVGIMTDDENESRPERLRKNCCNNLYAPWLLASICSRYNIHFTYVGVDAIFSYDNGCASNYAKMFTDEDVGSFSGTDYSAVTIFTDRLLKYFPKILNVHVRLPMNSDFDPHNSIFQIIRSSVIVEYPQSVTILSDCLPILIDLAIKHENGTINLVNPGPVKPSQIAAVYKKLIDPDFNFCLAEVKQKNEEIDGVDGLLSSSKIEKLYPKLRSAIEGIEELIGEMAKMNRSKDLKRA